MKNHRIIVIAILMAIAVALMIVSIFAFAYAGSSTPIINPSTTASGPNGNYPNEMMGSGWSGMMSSMMGGNLGPSSTAQTTSTAQNTVLPLIGLAALIGAAITSAGGAVYYIAVPKIRIAKPIAKSTVDTQHQNVFSPQSVVTPYASVSKTLTAEESKVMDVLVEHNGKYLQKYIRAETGLSRLKTHRIVMRLAERGVVTLEKSGNTNEVYLSSWLRPNLETSLPNQKYKDPIGVEAKV